MIYRLLVIFLFIFCASVNAQGINPKIQEIIKQTGGPNGSLTWEMHQEFWNEIRQLGTPKEIQQLKITLDVGILSAQEYQKELWESAKISYEKNRIVKTQRLIELETDGPVMFEKSLFFPKGSPNYKQAILAYREQSKITRKNSESLLKAAAARSSMTSAQGQIIPLDINMINTVLANLKPSFSRLENLFNEDWDGK